MTNTASHVQPALDILEHNDSYLLLVDLPGLPRDQLDVEVVNNELKISRIDTQHEQPPKHRVLRTLTLGKEVDADSVRARLQAGVLEIEIDKKKTQAARVIVVH